MTTWQALVDAAPVGAVVDLGTTLQTSPFTLSKNVTLYRGILRAGSGDLLTLLAGVAHEVEVDGQGTASRGIVPRGVASVRHCNVHDLTYAGVMGLSWASGDALDNEVDNIGVVAYQAAVAAGGPGSWDMNAYGICASAEGNGPQSHDVIIQGNRVHNVPSWHGLDTHGGIGIRFLDNEVSGCNRGLFITKQNGVNRPRLIESSRNTFTSPTPRPDVLHTPPYNEVAVSVFSADGVTGTGDVATDWPTALTVSPDSTGVTLA